jgi:hypothetical protein
MSQSSASTLAIRLRRKIGRRQRLARWGKWLILPALAAIPYLGRRNEWLGGAVAVLFLLELLAVVQGELLRCPFCEASLVSGRGLQEEFEATCPECGYPID